MMSKIVILFALFAAAFAGAVYSPAYTTYAAAPYASYAYAPASYYGNNGYYYGNYAPAYYGYNNYYGAPAYASSVYGYPYAYAPYTTAYSTILKK